jgi:hypothetical protein
MSATGFSNTNTHSVFHSMHPGKSLVTLVGEVELLVCALCKSSRDCPLSVAFTLSRNACVPSTSETYSGLKAVP